MVAILTKYPRVECFSPKSLSHTRSLRNTEFSRHHDIQYHHLPKPTTSTSLNMVFGFFKKRAEEGLDQLSNLSEKIQEGKIGEGWTEAAAYTKRTNEDFATSLTKSRNRLLYDIDALLNNPGGGGRDVLEELEDVLLRADIGTKTSVEIVNEIRELREDSVQLMLSKDDLRSVMRGRLIEALEGQQIDGKDSNNDDDTKDADNDVDERKLKRRAIQFAEPGSKFPTVLFIMGANGMGKTTTIGKLSSRLRNEGGQKVLLAACDTFRAGAVEQLEMWADRANVTCYTPPLPPPSSPVQKSAEGDKNVSRMASPSSVLYGALETALNDKYDTLIVDTSGRLSNNYALTEELKKMKRVVQKKYSLSVNSDTGKPLLNYDVPHETLLVVDAAQGRSTLDSARVWNEEVGITGLILTKLDGSAKGGGVIAVSRELNLPVKLIGIGEGIDDLKDFDPEAFVDGLLGIGSVGGKSKHNEGKVLAKRLDEMRKERNDRIKVTKKNAARVVLDDEKEAESRSESRSIAGEMTLQDSINPSLSLPNTNEVKRKNSGGKSKKKKGRRKNKKR